MKIVLGIDGSAWSQAAIQAVLDHPWPDGSEIRLVSVIRTLDTVIPAVELFFDTRSGAALGDLYVEAKRQLEIMAADLNLILTNCVFSADARVGDVAEGLMSVAETWQADLIVVGSHGKTGLAKLLLGSVSQALVTSAPCPVLVVKVKDHEQVKQKVKHQNKQDKGKLVEPDRSDFKRILVPIDDSYFSGVAMHWIAGRQWAEGAEFCLLHIANHDIDETAEEKHARHADHETAEQHRRAIHASGMYALEARAKYLADRMGHGRFTCRVVDGKPSHAIVEQANKWPADLIVMGSHGHQSKALLILGSTTREVTANALCSVEVVRVPHSLIPGHESHTLPEHEDQHIQIIDEPRKLDDKPHVQPTGMM
ncbi:MAG: universal stress protein [Cyanobacteria bacterium REEB67]|nr:universal stress protein [Cyanobacteria bacterium REEB67]